MTPVGVSPNLRTTKVQRLGSQMSDPKCAATFASSSLRVEADVLRTATSDRPPCNDGGQVGL